MPSAWGNSWADAWGVSWDIGRPPPPPPPIVTVTSKPLGESEGATGGYLVPPQWIPATTSSDFQGLSYRQTGGYLPPIEPANIAELRKKDPVRKKRRKLEDDLFTLD